jgi:hypothetical protein
MSDQDGFDAMNLAEDRKSDDPRCVLCMQTEERVGKKELWRDISVLQDAADHDCDFHGALNLVLKIYAKEHKLEPPCDWGANSDSTFHVASGMDYFELMIFPVKLLIHGF